MSALSLAPGVVVEHLAAPFGFVTWSLVPCMMSTGSVSNGNSYFKRSSSIA
ncbi:MAG TPA: hypothetical protein VI197_05765 [Polyangiaceae bacterium]